MFRHFCQKHKRAVPTSVEWLKTSSNCPRRQLISANHMSMITSSGGHTRSWKTFRKRAFHTYHRVKPAINIQMSENLGDADCKPLSNRILAILPHAYVAPTIHIEGIRPPINGVIKPCHNTPRCCSFHFTCRKEASHSIPYLLSVRAIP